MPIAFAQLYLCTDARSRQNDFADFVDAAYAGGVDIVQLRDRSLGAAEELRHLAVLAGVAARHGKLWAVNDRADIAAVSGAPVLHLGQQDLPIDGARSLLSPAVQVGLSTHSTDHVDAALRSADLGYFCVGPVWATPTKPGRAAVGLELVRYAARRSRETGDARPWFAIGGVDLETMPQVIDAGATRIVVVRAITEASDPRAAAQTLRAMLPPIAARVTG
ncbi:thiamine phosphate synthase [Luethyella okanaganae]|uniref:Thiamine-phosphate synthase n=1 Tax=Luethyella okanaganae TaxID=69372 RepID=A0ABW1VI76_9MICO